MRRRGIAVRLMAGVLAGVFLLLGGTPVESRSLEEQLTSYYAVLEELQTLEAATLADLVNLEFKLANERRVVDLLEGQLRRLAGELPVLEAELTQAELRYTAVRSAAQQAFRVLQLLGPTSYLEVLTGASSLREFFRRVNSALVLVRGAVQLVAQLRGEEQALATQYSRLHTYHQEQERLHQQAQGSLADLEALLAEKEQLLARLGTERASYEQALTHTEAAWLAEMQALLQALQAGFAAALTQVQLPVPGVQVAQVGSFIEITIPASVLNEVVRQTPELRSVVLVVGETSELIVPQRMLALRGPLELAGGARVRLAVAEIMVAGSRLHADTCQQLMEQVDIVLDFSPVATGLRLRSLTASDGLIVLTATPLIPFFF